MPGYIFFSSGLSHADLANSLCKIVRTVDIIYSVMKIAHWWFSTKDS